MKRTEKTNDRFTLNTRCCEGKSTKLDFQDMQAGGGWLIQLCSIFPTKMQQFLSDYLPELAHFRPQTRLFHH